jgi:RNA polymerase sigma factor (sigma-70 family)
MAIMIARFVDNKTFDEVAKEMGISPGRVSQIETKAREIMRKGWAA